MNSKAICELVKRRLKYAGLPVRLSPHSFRVTGITDLLTQGVPLDDVQFLAGHSSPRTTKLCDRRQKKDLNNTMMIPLSSDPEIGFVFGKALPAPQVLQKVREKVRRQKMQGEAPA
jgi:hypothetical protein